MHQIKWKNLSAFHKDLLIALLVVTCLIIMHEVLIRFKSFFFPEKLNFQHNKLPNYYDSLKYNDLQEFLDEET